MTRSSSPVSFPRSPVGTDSSPTPWAVLHGAAPNDRLTGPGLMGRASRAVLAVAGHLLALLIVWHLVRASNADVLPRAWWATQALSVGMGTLGPVLWPTIPARCWALGLAVGTMALPSSVWPLAVLGVGLGAVYARLLIGRHAPLEHLPDDTGPGGRR